MIENSKDLQRWFSERFTAQRGKEAVVFAVLLSIVGVIAVFMMGYAFGHPRSGQPSFTDTLTIERIQGLSQLVSTKVSVSDVMEGEGEGVRGVWLIKGDALIGVDLSKLSKADLQVSDEQKRLVTLTLPQPKVISARVDHERTMTYDVQRTTWIPWKGDTNQLRDAAMHHAQKLVEFAAGQPQLIEEAKIHAAHAISAVYKTVDWEVEVRWR